MEEPQINQTKRERKRSPDILMVTAREIKTDGQSKSEALPSI
jgi:hypothetical protein